LQRNGAPERDGRGDQRERDQGVWPLIQRQSIREGATARAGPAGRAEVRGDFIKALAVLAGAAPEERPADARQRAITRLAVLKAAAEFAAAGPRLASRHVLAIAERWELWVTH